MPAELPTEEAMLLKQQGADNSEIIERLKNKGYTYEEISDALTQAEMKSYVGEAPPAPTSTAGSRMQPSMMGSQMQPLSAPRAPMQRELTQQHFQPMAPVMQVSMPQPMNLGSQDRYADERIEEIAESIINEKWQKMMEDVGDINVWKEKIKTDVVSMKQEILRVETRFEDLQKAVLGKVSEYDVNIRDVGVEIKALEKLLQKIIEPLTRNVNELSKITEKLKNK